MSPTTFTGKRESGTARVLGSGASGIAELLVFHPVVRAASPLQACLSFVVSQDGDMGRSHHLRLFTAASRAQHGSQPRSPTAAPSRDYF